MAEFLSYLQRYHIEYLFCPEEGGGGAQINTAIITVDMMKSETMRTKVEM